MEADITSPSACVLISEKDQYHLQQGKQQNHLLEAFEVSFGGWSAATFGVWLDFEALFSPSISVFASLVCVSIFSAFSFSFFDGHGGLLSPPDRLHISKLYISIICSTCIYIYAKHIVTQKLKKVKVMVVCNCDNV